VDYLGLVGDAPLNMPQFPQLQTNEVAVFPIKSADQVWRFVSEEDVGMIAPAVTGEIHAGWPANIDGNIAFYDRELAGALLYGDFATMARAAAYLDSVSATPAQGSDPIYGLMRAEIGDNLLHEDSRWMIIASAAYVASASPRPTLDALIRGQINAGTGVRNPNDGLPAIPSLRLATLTLRRASTLQLPERILMLLVSHQEDPGMAWGIAKALIDNFDGAPMMISMEAQELIRGKPGAILWSVKPMRPSRKA